MSKSLSLSILFLSLALGGLNVKAQTTINEPIAEKIPTKLKKHGDVRIDDYFWLREKTSEKVLSHLKLENEYTKAMMKDTLDLQEKLYTEMKSRVKEDDQSVPYKRGNYLYFSKILKGQEYPVYCRKSTDIKSADQVLIDVNELATGLDFIKVTSLRIHPDENLMAYAVDTKGDRVFTIYFKDIKNGKVLPQKIENVTENIVWAETGKILFYGKQDPKTLRSDKIYQYDFETGKSKLVYTEKDEKFEAYVYKTNAKKFIFITANSTLSSEVRYIPANSPGSKFKIISPRAPKHEYSVYEAEDKFIIMTNWKAKNFRLMSADFKATQKEKWKEIIPHRKDVLLDSYAVFKSFIALVERSGGLTQVGILKNGETNRTYITFPDAAYGVSLGDNAEFDQATLRYDFDSMNRPHSVYDYDIAKNESLLLKEKDVPGYKSADYVSERVFATASDGAQIPISLVYKKGTKKDSSARLYVYGYGSYGMSLDPYFDLTRVSLLDRGFIYAIIHVRGGSEMGRHWYDDGKFFKKKNTFTDFIAGTEFLIKEKYGNAKNVYANGGSAGGLLMGAVINMRPDLYHGVVADVPFVDVVTTMLDSSIPLTTGEYEEWGNPNNKKYYEYMKSYSPYDNVKAQAYPNLFVTTGLNDSQVAYWEPAKWVAKLRDMRTDKSKLLLMKIEMEVGHGGKSGRFEYLREEAISQAFVLMLEGVK